MSMTGSISKSQVLLGPERQTARKSSTPIPRLTGSKLARRTTTSPIECLDGQRKKAETLLCWFAIDKLGNFDAP